MNEWRWRQRGGKDAIIPHEVRQWNTLKRGNNEKGIKRATLNSFLSKNFLL